MLKTLIRKVNLYVLLFDITSKFKKPYYRKSLQGKKRLKIIFIMAMYCSSEEHNRETRVINKDVGYI